MISNGSGVNVSYCDSFCKISPVSISCRKPISCLCFSSDGKYLATGEVSIELSEGLVGVAMTIKMGLGN